MSDQIRKMDEALEAPRSRRQLFKLAGAAGVGAAAAFVALPEAAGAASGDNMIVGSSNTATSETSLAYDNTAGNSAAAALAVTMENGNGWGLVATGIGLGDVKLSGTGRLQFYASTSTGDLAPTGSAGINEISMSNTGVLWAGESKGGTWRRINTLRVDSGDGSGKPFTPFRLYDSHAAGHGALSAGGSVSITAAGVNHIPANAIAVLGTLTAVATGSKYTSAGAITTYPAGTSRPSVPNVHFTSGSNNVTNFVVCGLAGGKLTVYASKATHFTLDIVAYLE